MEAISRTCRWVRPRLPLLVGGELAGVERRKVERHLIGCSVCRGRRDASAQTLSVLRGVAALDPVFVGPEVESGRPSVWPALARQIRESRHRPERFSAWDWFRSSGPWSAQPVIGFGLVAAGLVLGLGWVSWFDRPSPAGSARLGASVSSNGKLGPVPSLRVADPSAASAGPDEVFAILDDLEVPVARLDRRSSALPEGEVSRNLAVPKPGSDPFQPPLNLRLDYDLDWGTLSAPASSDTQRAY